MDGRRRDRGSVGADDPDADGRRGGPDRHQHPARVVRDVRQPARPLRRSGPRRSAVRAAGIPVGFTLVAPACSDWFLLDLADRYQRMVDRPLGRNRRPDRDVRGYRSRSTRHPHPCRWRWSGPISPASRSTTNWSSAAPDSRRGRPRRRAYRLVALAGTTPAKPGLVRVEDDGAAIEVEVWDMPIDHVRLVRRRRPGPARHRQARTRRRLVGERVRVRTVGGRGRDRHHPLPWLALLSAITVTASQH